MVCQQFVLSEVSKFAFTGVTICRRTSMHFTAAEVLVSIHDIEVLEGTMPSKQLKILLGWAAFHQEELRENWELAKEKQEWFAIEPLR